MRFRSRADQPIGDQGGPESGSGLRATAVSVALGGREIVHPTTLRVERGEWVTIVGPNGAGKSTLLRALAGLVPIGGRVEVGGVDVDRLSPRHRAQQIALVPQQPLVPPGMTVAGYVLLGRTPHLTPLGVEGQADLDVVADVLNRLDLETLADRDLTSLSGGELQRAQLARAVAQRAGVLLLDEPTTALDLGHQQAALELVDELRHEHGLSVVSTMHDLTLAGQYADRIVLLNEGHVVVDGAASEVLDEAVLARLYGASLRVINDDGVIIVVPRRDR
jgi:iron complex transport system ATP-binding protein